MFKRIIYLIILVLCVVSGYAQTLQKYEYWIDSDYSKRTVVKSTSSDISFSVSLAEQTKGVHFLNFRSLNNTGDWGTFYRYLYFIPDVTNPDSKITDYEYWFDNSYSEKTVSKSDGSDIALSLDISKLSKGVHYYNFRSKNSDGVWGNLVRYLFFIPDMTNTDSKITNYEYWMDDDYSFRVKVKSFSSDISLNILLDKNKTGVHYLNFRAENSESVWGNLSRYLVYIPEENSTTTSPIVGYRYNFNTYQTYVPISERNEMELSNQLINIPEPKEFGSLETGCKYSFDSISNIVKLNRKSTVNFSMQFTNKLGNWSSPIASQFILDDSISKTISNLKMKKSVTYDKVTQGDFCAFKISIDKTGNYFMKSTQACDIHLYKDDGSSYSMISSHSLLNTYSVGLNAGKYYGIVYNTIKDTVNTDNQLSIKLMLTDNIVPTPEILYKNDSIKITCAQEGASIYYTLDGSEPTSESNKYTESFELKHNAVVKAYASYEGLSDSYVTKYTIDSYKVTSPVIEFANLKIYITSQTPDSKIYYTLDGSDPIASGLLYIEPISLNNNCTIKAVAKRSGYNNSDITVYNLDVNNVRCVSPKFEMTGNMLTISSLTEGAVVYYTTDGSEPTMTSNVYNATIKLTHNCTFKAIAVKGGLLNSISVSYVVDWFQAESPSFSFIDGILTITCQTPGAKIYYEFGGKDPTAKSNIYTAPITLTDNRVVKAFVVADGFINSAVATYSPISFTCADATVTYDGRDIILASSTENASIYYTVDGSNPTAKSLLYTGKASMSGLCTVRTIVVKDNLNNSNVTTYELPCFYGGDKVYMKTAGALKNAFGWSGTDNITSLNINGPLNEEDLIFIRNLSTVNHLTLKEASLPENKLSDHAFAGMNILTFSSPSNIMSVGSKLFSGYSKISSITWNSSIAIPSEAISDIANPNMLLYVKMQSYAPSSVKNVVVNGNAQSITLSDADGNNNFYCPTSFTAQKISYIHNYSMESGIGVCKGWETIALPFDVQSIVHPVNGIAAPFLKNDETAKLFWLNSLDGVSFTPASRIVANTHYIICMPNNANYADSYLLAGDITFSAENTMVSASDKINKGYKGEYVFVPAFTSVSKSNSIYPINRNQEYNGYNPGSTFVSDLRDVRPFEAYITTTSASAKRCFDITDVSTDISTIPLKESEMKMYSENGIVYIVSNKKMKIHIYDMTGRLVKIVEAVGGVNAVRGLYKGIYMITDHKIIVK